MRALGLSIAVLLAALALGACGGDDNGDPAPITKSEKLPSEQGVSTAVRGYLQALRDGDGARACRLLDQRGKASLIAFLPSDRESIGCARAVRRVSRQVVLPRSFKVEDVTVSGRSASANVKGSNPRYASGVLLAYDNAWKISFPPGLQTKSGAQPSPAPGVPLEQD